MSTIQFLQLYDRCLNLLVISQKNLSSYAFASNCSGLATADSLSHLSCLARKSIPSVQTIARKWFHHFKVSKPPFPHPEKNLSSYAVVANCSGLATAAFLSHLSCLARKWFGGLASL